MDILREPTANSFGGGGANLSDVAVLRCMVVFLRLPFEAYIEIMYRHFVVPKCGRSRGLPSCIGGVASNFLDAMFELHIKK